MKEILVYITYEDMYNRVMIYHFKLMNHFIGRNPLKFPFYLYNSLTKMAHQVKFHPTKIAGRLSHHGLIKLIILELLQRRNMASTYFLFWNEFETGLQPEDKGKSPSKKSTTPRSGKRKRRDISLVAVDQASPTSKTNKAKRSLDFSGKEKEVPTQGKNILNLPYTVFDNEEEQEVDLTKQVAAEHEEFPSPTPREGQDEPMAEVSSRKPRS